MRIPKALAAALLALASGWSSAQFAGDAPDWKEVDVAPPPAFDARRLIGIETPRAAELRFGIDPATLSIQTDGVVRYVVVASSPSGATTAMYEGIRCATGEFKVYARHHKDGGWSPVSRSEWQSLFDGQTSRHTLSLARTGICTGRAPNQSVEHIVRDLRSSPDLRFR